MAGVVLKEESYRIMGACFEVHNQMGSGFLEAVYQECLSIEFAAAGVPFVEQPELQLRYKARALRSMYKPDFICFDSVIVEIKALHALCDQHRAQVHNYLKGTGYRLGILTNFGAHPRLEYERIVV